MNERTADSWAPERRAGAAAAPARLAAGAPCAAASDAQIIQVRSPRTIANAPIVVKGGPDQSRVSINGNAEAEHVIGARIADRDPSSSPSPQIEFESQLETILIDNPGLIRHPARMKTISIRELKAHWPEVERQIAEGETFEVLNRGRPAAMIVPPRARRVLLWDDHLASAAEGSGMASQEVVRADRDGRS